MKPSHRVRLTLTTTGTVAVVFAALFAGIWAYLRFAELQSARTYLDSGLTAALGELRSTGKVDDKYWRANHARATLGIFDNGRGKTPPVFPTQSQRGYGLASQKGRQFVYESADYGNRTLVAGLDWTEWSSSLHVLGIGFVVLFPILVAMVAAVTWMSAKATFKPLRDISNQAASIGIGDLSTRIDVKDAAEFGLFVTQINGLLTRIEQAVRSQEQFAADAAHELRTPLTVMRGKIETTLMSERSPAEYTKTMRALLKEVERLSKLSEALLQSARQDPETPPLLNIEPAVWEVGSRWLDRFIAKGVQLEINSGPANATILRAEIMCVLDNLLDNALRFSPPGSVCEITLEEKDGIVTLSVRDEGVGIKSGAPQEAFERFWREDSARSRNSGGFGIGLSVCKKLVESRGGRIRVDTSYSKGTRMFVTFGNPITIGEATASDVLLRNP